MLSARYMSQFVGDCPDEGVVAGYGNEFGQNIPQSGACRLWEMIFQTRSRAKGILPLPDIPDNYLSLHTWKI